MKIHLAPGEPVAYWPQVGLSPQHAAAERARRFAQDVLDALVRLEAAPGRWIPLDADRLAAELFALPVPWTPELWGEDTPAARAALAGNISAAADTLGRGGWIVLQSPVPAACRLTVDGRRDGPCPHTGPQSLEPWAYARAVTNDLEPQAAAVLGFLASRADPATGFVVAPARQIAEETGLAGHDRVLHEVDVLESRRLLRIRDVKGPYASKYELAVPRERLRPRPRHRRSA